MPDTLEPLQPNPFRAANIFRAVMIAFAAFYLFRLVGVAISILLAGFLGLLFGLNLSAAADFLQRWRIPRGVTAGGIVLLLFGSLGFGVSLMGPTLRKQGTTLRQELPKAIDALDQHLQAAGISIPVPAPEPATASPDSTSKGKSAPPDSGGKSRASTGDSAGRSQASAQDSGGRAPAGTRDSAARARATASDSAGGAARQNASGVPGDSGSAGSAGSKASGLRAQLAKHVSALASASGSVLSTTASAIGGVFIVVFIAIFYAVEPDLYRRGTLHLVLLEHRERVAETMSAAGTVLRRWLSAQFLAMLCVGALSTIAYLIIGIEAPLALGLIAGICEFVPFVGPVIAAVPAIGMALADSPEKALYVAGASLAIQQAEEVLIVPLLMKNNLTMPPILTIVAQASMGLAFGVLGLLVAVPLLAAVMVSVQMLYVEDVVGDSMGNDTPERQKK